MGLSTCSLHRVPLLPSPCPKLPILLTIPNRLFFDSNCPFEQKSPFQDPLFMERRSSICLSPGDWGEKEPWAEDVGTAPLAMRNLIPFLLFDGIELLSTL